MVFSRFSAGILVQLLLISVTGSLFLWSLDRTWLVVSTYSFALAFVLEIIYLFYYLHRTQRSLQNFLETAKYLDNVTDSMVGGISISKFKLSYNEIVDLIRKSRLDKELEHQYFRNTIEHINTGILSYDSEGKVDILNQAARDVLRTSDLRNIQQLEEIIPGLLEDIRSLKPGQNRLFSSYIHEESLLLTLRCSDFILAGRPIRLISLQNIKQEIEEEEIIAWQKLIRVLTHEIMNSVSPVKSLTHTLISLLEKENGQGSLSGISDETLSKCLTGLKAIENRSKALMSFVENYRSLTRIPEPLMNEITVKPWLESILTVMKEDSGSGKIEFSLQVNPSDLPLWGDEKLLGQALINILKNSIDALNESEKGRIEILASREKEGYVTIQISDNGKGISKEKIDSIFIPFYSTKEGGSGIGLSLARQIMQLHGASIRVSSANEITRFILQFR
jgi:two-component system, NtrC family, nitrogen regulation sensor histidine kinase NtrY